MGVDGSDMQEMTTTTDMSVTFSGAETGRIYTFSVIAKLDDLVSSPATTTVQIEEVIEEVPVPDEGTDSENPDGEDWNNGNNGNNGNERNNGNNGNNGNNR